jgi:hypothetical protein
MGRYLADDTHRILVLGLRQQLRNRWQLHSGQACSRLGSGLRWQPQNGFQLSSGWSYGRRRRCSILPLAPRYSMYCSSCYRMLTASRLLRAGVMLLFATQTSITEALRIRYPNTRQRAGPKETFSPSPLRRRSRQVRYGGRWFSSAKNLFHNFTKRRKRRILLWLDRRHVLWFDRRSLMWLDRSILL